MEHAGSGTGLMERWRRAPVAWRAVGAEVVVLPPGRDDPVALGGGPAQAWRCLAQPATVTAMAEAAGAPISEVQAALTVLAELGLVEAQ